jgi:hypothetical protein
MIDGVFSISCMTWNLKMITKLFLFLSTFLISSVLASQPEVYTVRSSSGKGLGVFALHDLEIGSIIMRETPILRIKRPDFVKGTGYPMSAVSQLVRSEFALLSPEEQEEVMDLTYYATKAEKESSDRLGLIFRSNAYNTGETIGLFPKIARINHSCRPNTSYYWNTRLNQRVVYANRKIKKGEELFDSYISLLITHEERQKQLDRYGFTCSCEACAMENGAIQRSDKRRVDIRKAFLDFEPQLMLTVPESKSAKRQARKNAKASLELIELVQKEGLADYYANAYKIAAISHARVLDWGTATNWANKGYELRVMEDSESPYAMEMYELTSKFVESWKSELRDRSLLKDEV